MNVVIIDDERLAREELKHLLAPYSDFINIAGEAGNGIEGIEAIEKYDPDLVFLDISMPEMDGFEMLKKLDKIPKVVFISAYDDYAIDAFKVRALDYLLKPVDPERLKKMIEKIKSDTVNEFYSAAKNIRENRTLNINDSIFIKDGEKCFFPSLKDVQFFESNGNYVRIYFDEHRPMILRSLNALEERLSPEDFFRANRQYIINIHFIKEIENWFNGGLKIKLKTGKEIEISRRQATLFKEVLSL